MINNYVTVDSPDRCAHKNVLKVVSGSEFLRRSITYFTFINALGTMCQLVAESNQHVIGLYNFYSYILCIRSVGKID